MMEAFAVTWMRRPYAKPFILDVDSLELAAEIGIRLNSAPGAYDIRVTTLADAEMDAETMAAIKQRISDRINYEWATGVMSA